MDDAQVVAIIAAIYQHAAVISGRLEIPDDYAAEWANNLLIQSRAVVSSKPPTAKVG